MTDEKINKEPVVVEPGATEPPAQPPSEPLAVPSAVDEEALKAIIEPLVKDAFDRGAQSTKDKRIAKQESRISSLEDTLAQVKGLQAEGMSEKQAIQFMRMEELLDAQGKQVPPVVPPATEPAVPATVAVDEGLSAVLKFTGLDSGEADVVAIIKANPNNELAQISAVTKLAESRKQAQTTPGSAAAVLPSGGGGAVVSEDMDSLSKRLTELVDLPVQTPESEAERAEIRAKINKLEPIQKTIVGV
ncbi:hypothetical protein LCGC14_2247160 [marine sediment metagenome]|uniref:Uncharacterized protein n=1 Tax=marine sediment metagenome TaxID=412755 RepID=A0A0F9D3G5_9ZZZZ